MTYHVETLPNGMHFLTAEHRGRVVGATVVKGTLTERNISRLKAQVKRYMQTFAVLQRMFNF